MPACTIPHPWPNPSPSLSDDGTAELVSLNYCGFGDLSAGSKAPSAPIRVVLFLLVQLQHLLAQTRRLTAQTKTKIAQMAPPATHQMELSILAGEKIVSCWISTTMMILRPFEGGAVGRENGGMPDQHQEE